MTTAPGEIKIKARLGDRVFSSSTIVAGSIILAVLAAVPAAGARGQASAIHLCAGAFG